jgi:hypothetical protein
MRLWLHDGFDLPGPHDPHIGKSLAAVFYYRRADLIFEEERQHRGDALFWAGLVLAEWGRPSLQAGEPLEESFPLASTPTADTFVKCLGAFNKDLPALL